METVQLSYFILACQFRNHAEAAAQSKLSASALSENIYSLERELGLKLFQRGPQGHYPTEAARWLYQSVEPLLQTVEVLDGLLERQDLAPLQRLEVISPLQFMAGRLSRTMSLAVRAMRRVNPTVIAAVRFALSRPPYIHVLDSDRSGDQTDREGKISIVTVDYGFADEIAKSATIFEDEWIALGCGVEGADADFDTLRRFSLFLPPLGTAQLHQAYDFCRANKLPTPMVIEEDVGTLERLSRETQPFHLLAPQSLVAASAARSRFSIAKLPKPLVTPVVARCDRSDPIACSYLSHLRSVAAGVSIPVMAYEPAITLKQLRYFLAVADNLNVTIAARQLHTAQPALSSQLKKLEKVLGGPLFDRRRTGVVAKESANILAALITPPLVLVDSIPSIAAHYSASREEKLAIGVMPMDDYSSPIAQAVAVSIEEWSSQYPSARLRVVEAPTKTLRRLVDSGEVGFALVDARVSSSSQLDLNAEDALGVVSRAGSGLLVAGDVSLSTALKLPLVLPGSTSGLRQLIDEAAAVKNQQVAPQIEVDSSSLLIGMLRRMHLVSILPQSSVAHSIDRGELQFNPLVNPRIGRRLSIVFSPDRLLTNLERALVTALRQHLSAAKR